MNNHSIVFLLTDNEKIVLRSENSIEHWHCCYDATIVFSFNSIEYKFPIHDIQAHMESFGTKLKKALENKLQLHQSITKDIGYLWNEAYQDKPGFIYEGKEGEVPLWVGDHLRIWASGETGEEILSTWIYNDKNGAIILEITPDYPWYDCDPEEYANYIPYEEWIKSYKPLVIRTIPADVARQWLEQANDIVKKIHAIDDFKFK